MKVRFTTVTAIVAASAFAAAAAQTYTASLNNPAAEAQNWFQGGTDGGSWNNCIFKTGIVEGSQAGNGAVDDSVCVLKGVWSSNQSAQVVVAEPAKLYATFNEVEVHVNTTISPGKITGYELTCSLMAGAPYLQLARWNGKYGSFTGIGSSNTYCRPGDVLGLLRLGDQLTAYKNGITQFTVTDETYLNGSPGMGFYIGNGYYSPAQSATADAAFGVSAFTAMGGAVSPPPPAATVTIQWTNPNNLGQPIVMRAAAATNTDCAAFGLQWTTAATLPIGADAYVDGTVTAGNYYCYGVAYLQAGLYSPLSGTVLVDVTTNDGAGVVMAQPAQVPAPLNVTATVKN